MSNKSKIFWYSLGGTVLAGAVLSGIFLSSSGDETPHEDSTKRDNSSASFPWARATAASDAAPTIATATDQLNNPSESPSQVNTVPPDKLQDAKRLYENFTKNPNGAQRTTTIMSVYERLGRNFANAPLIGLTPQSLHGLVTQSALNSASSSVPYYMTELPQDARDGGRHSLDVIRDIYGELKTTRGAFLSVDNGYDTQKTVEGYTLSQIENTSSKVVLDMMNRSLTALRDPQTHDADKGSYIMAIEQGIATLKQNAVVNKQSDIKTFEQIVDQFKNKPTGLSPSPS